jgi:hypothetical protein
MVTSVQKYSNIVISREGGLDYAVIHLLDVSPAMNYTIMLNMYICAYICAYIVLVGICSWPDFVVRVRVGHGCLVLIAFLCLFPEFVFERQSIAYMIIFVWLLSEQCCSLPVLLVRIVLFSSVYLIWRVCNEWRHLLQSRHSTYVLCCYLMSDDPLFATMCVLWNY